uniref:Integrase catalytic domain-containing protein n=1 Tax=Trichuris muris TaxID=70415 RepID=A0A5S6Q738_TRIMR
MVDMLKGRKNNESSKLIGLNAFLGRENIVRVGGRIRRADVDYSIKHPVALLGKCSLAHRIVWQCHLDLMHAGIERHGKTLRFTCLVSRAVHLELTPSLNLNSVVLALKRFISRRGRPKVIFSDNGKCFTKTAKCLEEELTNLDLEKLSASTSDLRIHWKFSPPNGPHFGGVWERLIGMAKKALTATLQGNSCTDEVLGTVFAEVEAILNGRPLCYIGDDPSNPEPLTPFLLLTGRANVNVPLDITCVKDCTLSKHWCHEQLIVDRFWRRWLKEYLPTLQRRSKWTKDHANLEVGDVVVIVEPQLPRGQWPLAA